MAAGGGPAISPPRTPDGSELDDEDHERLDAMNADIEGNYENLLRIFSAILNFKIVQLLSLSQKNTFCTYDFYKYFKHDTTQQAQLYRGNKC